MLSQNMNYRYNVEYFDDLDFFNDDFVIVKPIDGKIKNSDQSKAMRERTKEIIDFPFPAARSAFMPGLEDVEGVHCFELHTAYPGLLIGIGEFHDLKMRDAVKNGFTFDYVTGLPYLPGSSLKGILHSYFPVKNAIDESGKYEYIKSLLPEKNIDIFNFSKTIFGDSEKNPGKVLFLGAFPIFEHDESLLSYEYITPHRGKFANPKPISMIKIKPDIKFRFVFRIEDYKDKNEVTAEEIKLLFKQIIVDMGIGARTNVGFGVMVEKNENE